MFKVHNKSTRKTSPVPESIYSIASIVDFEQVNVNWERLSSVKHSAKTTHHHHPHHHYRNSYNVLIGKTLIVYQK